MKNATTAKLRKHFAEATCVRATIGILALVFSCAARKWVLGTKAEEEAGLLRQQCTKSGTDVPLSGFYCFGEIAPFERSSDKIRLASLDPRLGLDRADR